MRTRVLSLIAVVILAGRPVLAADVAIVLDASNSMWGQIDGVSKIEIAREVMGDIIDDFAADTRMALVTYGHRVEGDCGDIETVIPLGTLEPDAFLATFNAILPRGKTPLSASVIHAAEALAFEDQPATVVLLSDGIETCNADPCAVAAELERKGVGFTAHVIGFDVADVADQAQLRCIADNSGGQFFAAKDADELRSAMTSVAQVASEPEPEPAPEPEPEPEPEPATVTLTAPQEAVAGSEIEIGWTPVLADKDYVTVVAADADDDEIGNHVRANARQPATVDVPGDPGLYEVRYLQADGRIVQGRHQIELVEAEVTLESPETSVAGSRIEIGWSPTINKADFITIVPADADDNEVGGHVRANKAAPAELNLPGEPGLYELRYVLKEGRRPVARRAIELTAPEVTLDAPTQAVVGTDVPVAFGPAIHPGDFVTIVPADAAKDDIGPHVRGNRAPEARLSAPGEPGLYEIRYVLNTGRTVVARTGIELIDASVTLVVPETAMAGSAIEVEWTPTIDGADLVTIVPVDADEDEIGTHFRANRDTPQSLTVPSEPGLYQVRYVLNQGRRVIAAADIEVETVAVTLDVPAEVMAGAAFAVAWNQTIADNDIVTIVPADAGNREVDNHVRAGRNNPAELTAPGEPGLYEVRYVLPRDYTVVGRAEIDVTQASVSLSAAEVATAGSKIEVTWGQAINDADFITVVPEGADEGRIDYSVRAGRDNPGSLPVPTTPGRYEIRYVLAESQATVVRKTLEVEAANIVLDVVSEVEAGAAFDVAWGQPIDGNDIITIVPPEAPDDELAGVTRVRSQAATRLQAPSEPGLYEVRYVLSQDYTVAARSELDVVAVRAALIAPQEVVAGARFDVMIDGPRREGDRIVLADAGAAADNAVSAAEVGRSSKLAFLAPKTPGLYEVRYILGETGAIIGRTELEVAGLDASLSAPGRAAANSRIEIGWTGPGAERDRITLATPDMSDTRWVKSMRTSEGNPLMFDVPAETGSYELRYLSADTRNILARQELIVD
ncbi:MAG: VWA domain-containing protein [Geminicoccaceae bacterium]